MANVLHRTADPVIYLTSVDPSNHPVIDWIRNPNISAVDGLPTKYWKRPLGDPVLPMTQPERDAVDAQLVVDQIEARRDEASNTPDRADGDGVRVRALIELFNKRDNYLVNRISELQTTLTAMKNTSGGADNIRNAIPTGWLATNTRTKAAAVQDYKDDIQSGNQDI